jgi:monoterpene epsilon-lactone hydrolase
MRPRGRASLRAEIARLGLRWLVRHGSHHQTIAQARARFRAMEMLIPRPPADTRTTPVDAGGVPAEWVVTPASRDDRQLLFLHGGGYRLGAPSTYRHFTWRLVTAARAHLLALDYRLAPEHPFPAALDDALAAYNWMQAGGLRTLVVGDSSGGGLALALLLKLRDKGLRLPAAAVALSPWTDLALTGPSLERNAAADPMLNADDLPKFAADYLAGADPRNPYASPLYGDLTGLPPTLIHVGDDEILRDDAVRMAEKMRAAHCRVELQVWPRMPHGWHLLAPVLPEAKFAIAGIGEFIERMLQVPDVAQWSKIAR